MEKESRILLDNSIIILQSAIEQFRPQCPDEYKKAILTLYENTHDLLDQNFINQIQSDFPSRLAELVFSCAFRFALGLKPEHKSDAGPDLWLNSIGAWAEIVTATDGDPSNLNSLNPGEENEDKKLLRFTNAIAAKTAKFSKDIHENRVNPSDKLIICIYPWVTNWLPCYPANGLPDIVRAVYPAGDYQLLLNKSTEAIENHQYSFRDVIQKRKADGSIASIYTNTFLNVQNSHITGVLFSPNPGNFLNHSEIGSDFIFVHNALAENKVLPGELNVGEEYRAELSIQKYLNRI